jgi:hypothetical protein
LAHGVPSLPSWPCRFDPGHPLHACTQVNRPVRLSGEAPEEPLHGLPEPFRGPHFPCVGHEWITPLGSKRATRQPWLARSELLQVTAKGHAVISKPGRAEMQLGHGEHRPDGGHFKVTPPRHRAGQRSPPVLCRFSGDLQRFVDALSQTYDQALLELRAGGKRTYWMWFVPPADRRRRALRHGPALRVSGLEEARTYAGHRPWDGASSTRPGR